MVRFEDDVDMNGSPKTVDEMNDLPIKTVGTNTIYIRDVAHVRDGNPPQTNIVLVDGQRAALMTVMKLGATSTLDIINKLKERLPIVLAGLPPNLQVRPIADQSLFVRASINGVVREAVIAACLTGLMILIFLGSWRSTLIIAVSIPLSILTSIIVLSAIGQTINIMTLGGLALAVGILVDDATVEIENINRNLAEGKEIIQAILDGAQQIAVPAFVSTLSICIVFVPMFFLTGVAQVFVRAAGRSRRVRDAGFVPAVAHAGADDGAVSAEGPRGGVGREIAGQHESPGPIAGAFRIAIRKAQEFLPRDPASLPGAHDSFSASFFWRFASVRSRCTPGWARISSRRWMPDKSSFTSAHRPRLALKRRLLCAATSSGRSTN